MGPINIGPYETFQTTTLPASVASIGDGDRGSLTEAICCPRTGFILLIFMMVVI
jgi:hypothetical protein